MIAVGNTVRVLAPFDAAYPDTYLVAYVREDGTVGIQVPSIEEPRDFDPKYLELVP